MHIAIAGNIGSGKTTLTKMLAKRYGWKANFEPVDNNPYVSQYVAALFGGKVCNVQYDRGQDVGSYQ